MKFQEKFYSTILQSCFDEFRIAGQFCDVILVIDEQEFKAHKLILSAASPYFRAMFNSESNFIESKQEKINLHGVDKNAFSGIMKFIYSSDIDINDDNVFILMEAASFLQINALKSFIGFYLQHSLRIENCFQLYVMASLHHYHDLASNSLNFLLTNFSKAIEESDEFNNLSIEMMLEIMSSKLLNVPNEEALLEIVIKWVEHDSESRAQYMDALLSKINLNSFSIKALKTLKNHCLATTSLIQKLDDIISFKSSRRSFSKIIENDERYNFHKFRHKAEKPVIFAIGGESSGRASKGVECFTLGFDKWKCIVPECIVKGQETKLACILPPLRCARYYAACVHDKYNVYVVGGKNSTTLLDECEVFDSRTNQWNYFQKIPEKLYAGGAAFIEGELMVVGGCCEKGITDKVWRLDKNWKTWTPMPPIHQPRYFHGTVSSGGYVYVLGGYKTEIEPPLKACMKFDPGSNKWFKIAGMQEARAMFGCAAIDNFIYVFGGISDDGSCLKSVERYNTFTDEWNFETSMSLARHSFSVAVTDHEIYCLGGSDSIHYLDSVEKFSLRTKRWHWVHSLQISRFAPAAAALSVPYHADIHRDGLQ